MKIGSSPPIPAPPLSGRTAAPNPSAARPNGGGFLDTMQGTRRNGYLEVSICDLFRPYVETGAGSFAVETAIGDDAVRFDARAIVAPTGGQADADTQVPASAPPAESEPSPDRPAQSALAELVGELAERVSIIARQVESLHLGTVRSPAMPTDNIPASPTATPTAPGSSPAALRRTPAAPTRPGEAASALRYVPDPASSSTPTLARVTALPRDILVVLRGISLSAEESFALVDKMRGVLARHRLGDRMIRIVGTGAQA